MWQNRTWLAQADGSTVCRYFAPGWHFSGEQQSTIDTHAAGASCGTNKTVYSQRTAAQIWYRVRMVSSVCAMFTWVERGFGLD